MFHNNSSGYVPKTTFDPNSDMSERALRIMQGFFQDFRQEGANVTIVESRGACTIVAFFRVFVIEGMQT